MHRPIISLILIAVVAVVALIKSGIVKVEIELEEPVEKQAKKSKDAIKVDEISEAEVVEEEDPKDGNR